MEQLERIRQMEEILDRSTAALAALSDGLEQYQTILPELQTLCEYYESGLWMQDYDADCAGKIPSGLKRGVLSEDAIYNLLAEHERLKDLLQELNP